MLSASLATPGALTAGAPRPRARAAAPNALSVRAAPVGRAASLRRRRVMLVKVRCTPPHAAATACIWVHTAGACLFSKAQFTHKLARRSLSSHSNSQASAAAPTTDLPPELAKIVAGFQMVRFVEKEKEGPEPERQRESDSALSLSRPFLNPLPSIPPQVPDPKIKYAQLLAYGKKLAPLPAADHTDAHKVRGCVSQVWVVPEVRDDGTLHWSADSDSALTKGLAALLVLGLSGCPPAAVARLSPDWITQLGLAQSLTPSRNNGFLNMFRLMQQQALSALVAESEAEAGPSSAPSVAAPAASPAPSPSVKPVRAAIETKLTAALAPLASLAVIDESGLHAGHTGAKGVASPSGETHFKVVAVSPAFEGLGLVARHRLVYGALAEELAGPVHALTLETRTPAEVEGKK